MERKSLILKTIEEQFGTAEPVYAYFEKRTEAEIKESLSGCGSQELIDQVLYLFFQLFTDDDCPIAVPLQNYFWAYFHCMVNDIMGFTKNYAAVGPTEDTFTIHGDVVFKLINSCQNIEFRSVSEFNALIALRMHWHALDIIKKNKREAHVTLDPSQMDSRTDFLEGIFSKEERLAAESAVSQLSKEDQKFFADCLDDMSYDGLAKKYLPHAADVEKAKDALRQRKARLRNRLKKIANTREFAESTASVQASKPVLLVL